MDNFSGREGTDDCPQARRRDGIAIRVVPNGPAGSLDVGRLEEMLAAAERPPKLLCVSMIPTSSGTVQPAAAVGAVAERHGVPYNEAQVALARAHPCASAVLSATICPPATMP